MPSMTIEERRARVDEITARQNELDAEHPGDAFPEEARGEFEALATERAEHESVIDELEARQAYLTDQAADPRRQVGGDGAEFQTARPGATRGEDIWDLSTVRGSAAGPHEMARELRDRAMHAIERAQFAHEKADREAAQGHIEHLLATRETETGDLARYLLATGSPTYHRAFDKALKGRPLSDYEQSAQLQAALSVGTESAGGFAVPFQLDPTVIPTSNSSVNPYRAISRVETLVGTNEWKGVSSAGVTATRRSEAAETADNAPTLAQPSVTVERVDAFVPFSIEVGMDWAGLQGEMARAIQDAKDDEEAESFTRGTGVSPEPEGIIVGATSVLDTENAHTFAVGDVYAVEEALPPRFRPRAQWAANRSIYNRVRRFDTQGGADLWVDNLRLGLANQVPTPGNTGATLLGYPANECSELDSSTAEAGNSIAVLGDWRYFLIAERLGMTIELVPHLVGTNRRPTGQRGYFAYWRNSSVVLSANAFRVLQVGSGS